jgi:methyltransferase (TIGR00027 family)
MKPISKTAFYCCGVRMQDAEASTPVCGDMYAKKFMNEDGLRIHEAFKDEVKPNASNVVRHRIIDDFLRQELGANQSLQIVLIGAGFDSRAYRLIGGKWVELDEPQITNYKNERLPLADCRNELQRIPIDFSTDSLEQKLSPFSSHTPTIVVIEGVFMYLQEDTIGHLLLTLRRLFHNCKVICDLMSRKFFEKYSRTLHEKIVSMGTSFNTVDNPGDIFIDNGYRLVNKVSIVGRAVEFGTIKIPKIFFHVFLRTLSKGYSVYVFEPNER